MGEDLSLGSIENFRGTEQYHNVMGINVTDGVAYVMENGYSWFVTDFLSLIATNHKNLKEEEFLSIRLVLDGSKGKMVVTDGNEKELYTQEYKYTNAEKELWLYFTDGVLLLSQEY